MEEFKPYHKVGGIQYAVFGLVKRGLLEQQKGESFKITKLGEDLLKS
jgi:predicted transcriptional regulator